MLGLKGMALVKNVVARREFHGDDNLAAVTIRLVFDRVPVQAVVDAFLAQGRLMFDVNGAPQFPELGPLSVEREIQNVEARIGGITFAGLDVGSVQFTPKPLNVYEVDLKLSGLGHVSPELHECLGERVEVSLDERQSDLVQEQAPKAA